MKRLIQVLVSCTLLGILIYWINCREMYQVLQNANIFLLGLALLLATFNRILMAVKWNILLRAKGIHLSWGEVTRIYYSSSFLGVFLPPTIGMDAVKAHCISRKGYSLSDVVSSILVERLLGMISLLLFGLMGGAIFVQMYGHIDFDMRKMVWLVLIVGISVISIFVISLSQCACDVVLKIINRWGRNTKCLDKVIGNTQKLLSSYQRYGKKKGILALFFGLTCFENTLPIIRPFIIAMALHAAVPLSYFFVIVPIELTLSRLPISFDGFGIREGVFVYFLTLIGISHDMAFSIGLTNHLLFLVALLPGWVILVSDREYVDTRKDIVRMSR